MANFEITALGLDEFKKALERNPEVVARELKNFIQRAISKYRSGILNSPWKLGGSGGGSPVATGNLRDTHRTEIKDLEGRIYPTAKYATFVHEGTGKLEPRPWLDWVKEDKDKEVEDLQKKMMDLIIKDLSR